LKNTQKRIWKEWAHTQREDLWMDKEEGGQLFHTTTTADTSIEDVFKYTTKTRHVSAVVTSLNLCSEEASSEKQP